MPSFSRDPRTKAEHLIRGADIGVAVPDVTAAEPLHDLGVDIDTKARGQRARDVEHRGRRACPDVESDPVRVVRRERQFDRLHDVGDVDEIP